MEKIRLYRRSYGYRLGTAQAERVRRVGPFVSVRGKRDDDPYVLLLIDGEWWRFLTHYVDRVVESRWVTRAEALAVLRTGMSQVRRAGPLGVWKKTALLLGTEGHARRKERAEWGEKMLKRNSFSLRRRKGGGGEGTS